MGERRTCSQQRLDAAAFKRRRKQDKARRITTRDARMKTMSDVHEHEDKPADEPEVHEEDMATSAEASEAAADDEAEPVAEEAEIEPAEEEAHHADE